MGRRDLGLSRPLWRPHWRLELPKGHGEGRHRQPGSSADSDRAGGAKWLGLKKLAPKGLALKWLEPKAALWTDGVPGEGS